MSTESDFDSLVPAQAYDRHPIDTGANKASARLRSA